MEYRKIHNEAELFRELGIDGLDAIRRSASLKKRVAAKLPYLSPKLVEALLAAIPELAESFRAYIATMGEIGRSLEATKRARWETLQKIAATGIMSGDQILEAMRIIADREEKERVDWNAKMDGMKDTHDKTWETVGKIVLAVIAVGAFALAASR